MLFFKKKLTKAEIGLIQRSLDIANESSSLVNETVNPEVFFGRLHLILDTLLYLSKYDDYKIFSGGKPSTEYQRIIDGLEDSVGAFIERSYQKNLEKAQALKTEKGQQARMQKYAQTMFDAFDSASDFWEGYEGRPHYSGKLYTEGNLEHLHARLDKYI